MSQSSFVHSESDWWLQSYLALRRAPDPDALFQCVRGYAESWGFTYCSFGLRIPTSVTAPFVCILDSYPAGWMEHYRSQGYVAQDPTIYRASRDRNPVVWSDEVFATSSALWGEAQESGLRVGLAQGACGPFGAFGLLSVARETQAITTAELSYLSPLLCWLADNVQERFRELSRDQLDAQAELTSRERDVLSWTADGKTSWEISKILMIAESTVNFHIKNIVAKLGARNKMHAASKAAALGLLFAREPETAPRSGRAGIVDL